MIKRKFRFAVLASLCVLIFLTFAGCEIAKNDDAKTSDKGEEQGCAVRFYDYNGSLIGVKLGEDDTSLTYVQYVDKGEAAVAPISPVREGYDFTGWDKEFDNITVDLDIHAQYVQMCDVLFYADNEIYEVRRVEYGGNAEPPYIDPQKSGYRFDRWEGRYTGVFANTSVFAVFVKQYDVTFAGYNGETLKKEAVDINAAATAPIAPAVEGRVFDGWDKDFSRVTEDITVNAIYTEASSFVVRFADYNGTPLKEQRVYTGTAATAPDMDGTVYIDFDSREKQGYVFDGWDKDFSRVTEDITVNAQYVKADRPILFVKSEAVIKGGANYVTVSVYVVSDVSFSALGIGITYDERLDLTENNVSVKSVFNTQDRYDLKLDEYDRELRFSWFYTSGEYRLYDNYAKVLELTFEIDEFISVGEYGVEIISGSYVTDYMTHEPMAISGAVTVEEGR